MIRSKGLEVKRDERCLVCRGMLVVAGQGLPVVVAGQGLPVVVARLGAKRVRGERKY